MTLQQLEYFLAALDEGSFSAAAERLLLAQPSLSEQVRRLEAELGVALFTRVGRGLRPTDAGAPCGRTPRRRWAPSPRGARRSSSEARAAGRHRHLRHVRDRALLPPGAQIVSDFRQRHPKVRVRVVGQNSSEVADAVRDGDARGRAGRAADRRPRPRRPADHAGGDPLRQRRPRARQKPDDDRAARPARR